jgi:hypothetical protein
MPTLDEDTARMVYQRPDPGAGRPPVRELRGRDAHRGPLAEPDITGLYHIAAIDPGDAWGGLSEIDLAPLGGRLLGTGFVDQSTRGKIRLMQCRTLRPEDLLDELDKIAPQLHAVILERFSLYPWMAREQGFSEMLTPQMIGVVKWIARSHKVPVYLQDSKGVLKSGRTAALQAGFKMKDRVLGSGQWKYRGPDFDLPGKPHRRDSASHGMWWIRCSPDSPLR